MEYKCISIDNIGRNFSVTARVFSVIGNQIEKRGNTLRLHIYQHIDEMGDKGQFPHNDTYREKEVHGSKIIQHFAIVNTVPSWTVCHKMQ